MDAPSGRRVSLRGASAKEDSRAVLLEKIAEERASRVLAKRMAAGALTIQKTWRGQRIAKAAADEIQRLWDVHIEQIQSSQSIPDAEVLANDVLRPFLFFSRHMSCHSAKDLRRVSLCFHILLLSLKYSDNRNICTLALGTQKQKAQWLYQIHKVFAVCSAILMAERHSDEASSLLTMVMRTMVTLTDVKLWNGFESRQQEAGDEVLSLLQWLAEGNGGFYYAAHVYLLRAYGPFRSEEQAHAGTKQSLVVTASVLTMALRPLHVAPTEHMKGERYEESRGKAAAEICRHILTVPCLIDRLPAGLVPAFQHSNVLGPCLQACKDFTGSVSHSKHSPYDTVPQQAWVLANVVSIVSIQSYGFLKELVYNDFVEAVCSLLQSLAPWIEAVRERRKHMEDSEGGSVSFHNDVALDAFIGLLKPLYQQRHLVQLLDKAAAAPSALPRLAKLYSGLLSTYSALNSEGGALPVLNVLAFTKQVIPQLWDWLRSSVKLETVLIQESKLKEENSGSAHLSSKWANSFLKRMKNASNESVIEDSRSSGIPQSNVDRWHISQLRDGAAGILEEAVPVFTLFCTVYAHLLLVLDDDEFYNRQVPFSIDEQRTICAALNTMVYHDIFRAWKPQFSSLMEASCRCLRALYERDSRRSFCPADLWLAPGMEMRPAIAAAARAHEVASASKQGEAPQAPAIGSILTTIPHVLPFEERVQIFREFVKSDKNLRKMGGEAVGPGPGSIEISIRRDRIVEDGFQQLSALGPRLKGCINVSFVNEYGLPEAGLDYGGLFKEFLTDLAKAAFDPRYGLFLQTATEEGFLFPHPAASILGQGLRTMEFLGRIVGKALYEGILLEHSFSPVFISKILGRYSPIDDLASLDIELHRNLMYLKTYEGDVSDLALDFTVTEEIFGKRKVIELIPGGAKISVTEGNKLQYVHAMADYKLNRQVKPVVNAFIRGLTDLIAPSWLGLFNAKEFNQLLSGEEHDFDVHDLKANTRYTGGYSESSRTVKLFWEVLDGLDAKERCAVLKFVTSCSRAPLLGFKHLQPPFTIHKVTCDTPVWTFLAGQDVDRLPTASTCYNILKLPTYRRSSTLREKLQYAIRSNSGFELS